MVNIIEDWDVPEEYAGEKLGFYQLLSNDGIIEVKSFQNGRIRLKRVHGFFSRAECEKIYLLLK